MLRVIILGKCAFGAAIIALIAGSFAPTVLTERAAETVIGSAGGNNMCSKQHDCDQNAVITLPNGSKISCTNQAQGVHYYTCESNNGSNCQTNQGTNPCQGPDQCKDKFNTTTGDGCPS